jgi:hypothetical protein
MSTKRFVLFRRDEDQWTTMTVHAGGCAGAQTLGAFSCIVGEW